MSKGLERALKVVADENGELLKYKKALEIAKKHKLFNPFKNAILRRMYNLSDEEWEFIEEVLL